MSIMPNTFPHLLADIGGTNARFALEIAQGEISHIQVLCCKDYPNILEAILAYLASIGNPKIKHGGIAIANPILTDWVSMTNHHWAFSIQETKEALGFETLLFINDFTAQAFGVLCVNAKELRQIGGMANNQGPKAILGPGTGLGVSGLIPKGDGEYLALSGEGGHMSFAPFNKKESLIWQYAKEQFGGHVSAERFLSGPGLVLIYQALAFLKGIPPLHLTPKDVTTKALSKQDALCLESLEIFCSMLGTVASNLALILGARGGVYLCGGIIPCFIDYFQTSPFRSRFEDKGRFGAYLADIPVYVVLAQYPGILGVGLALEQSLQASTKEQS